MIGRYGADELAKAQSIAALVLHFFVDVQPSWHFLLAGDRTDDLFHMENVLEEYFRKICRKSEISQLQISDGCEVGPVQKASGTEKNYRFYKCPQCKQKVRVPKGRGKICITCPKCRTEFVKKVENKRRFFHVWLYQYQSKRIIGRK